MLDLFICYLRSFDLTHLGVRRSGREQRLKLSHTGGFARYHYLDPTVVQVPRVTVKAERPAGTGYEPAKSHSLHFATHQKSCCRHSERALRRRFQMM